MNVVSTFSGIGGFDLGLERAGFCVIAQVENDPFCQRVLKRRWPNCDRWSDIIHVANRRGYEAEFRKANAPRWPDTCDLLAGGFPCQDLSVAGKRAGLSGARSSLFHEYVRIAKALTPTWGLVENVPGLLSSHGGRDFWLVLTGLRECWPVVGWRVLDSQHFGVAQRRRRVFLVGGPTEASVAEVLALTEGSSGDSPAGGEAGPELARTLVGGAAGTRSHGKPNGSDRRQLVIGFKANMSAPSWGVNIAETLQAKNFRTPGGGTREANLIAHALMGEQGFDASEDGTGRGTPLIASTQITSDKNYSSPKPDDPCHPLAAGAHAPAIIGGPDASTSEVDAGTLLRRVRQEVGAEAFTEWGSREYLIHFTRRKFCDRSCMAKNFDGRPVKSEPGWMTAHYHARKIVPPGPCSTCGKPNALDVHHKNGNWRDNSTENLVRLCRGCHLRETWAERKARAAFGD